MSIRDQIEELQHKLHKLNLGEVVDALRDKRQFRQARRVARHQFKHEAKHKLGIIDRIERRAKRENRELTDGERRRIETLEREARHADARVGELHSVISRATERIGELIPKVTWRRKRKRHILKNIRKLRHEAHQQAQQTPSGNMVPMDGKIGAGWIVRIALEARAAGYWHGVAISLFRTKEYSISLCEAICGQPFCSGTCAGALTNHCCPSTYTCKEYEGAGDFSDPYGLDRYCQDHNKPLIGNGRRLPYDINHFSNEGN